MPHRLNAYLASNRELLQLSGKARELAALQRQYESMVPPSLQRSSRVLQLHQHTLFIAANNGAVAAKLRQMTSDLISLFQARGCEVTGIQIKVQVTFPPRNMTPRPRKLGKQAHDALSKLQENIEDSPLRTALRRLLQRT